MKLSDLVASEVVPERAFGVIVDTEALQVPEGLREISFVTPQSDEGIDTDVLDAAILYLLTKKVEVTIEFRAEDAIKDAAYLVQVGTSIGAGISLLPPEDQGDDAFEAYVQRLEQFVRVYCELSNVVKPLMPVTSYLEYLLVEMMDPETAGRFAPKDQYVMERFASVMTEERADSMKERMRAAFEGYYGGRQGFVAHFMPQLAMVYAENEAVLDYTVRTKIAAEEAAAAE